MTDETTLPTTGTATHAVANRLVAPPRGVLAADESIGTMSSRLFAAGVDPTEETRRAYRALLLGAEGLADTVSGIIWCDETFRQTYAAGETFPEAARRLGILPGIKVDTGTRPHPGASVATVTQGLDGLADRMQEYAELGAAFAKWRAVIDIADAHDEAISANAASLAEYAAVCQAYGVVPIVEPEVLCSGAHDLDDCARVTGRVLRAVFAALEAGGVDPAGMVLKPNLVTPGLSADPRPAGADTAAAVVAETVAASTLTLLLDIVPPEVPGIAFLSGGHSNTTACAYLGALNRHADRAPWSMTYSFGRALVADALVTWAGEDGNVARARQVLLANCARASAATAR